MTKAELVKEYNQLWTLTNKELNYIRDTDSYTKENLYVKFIFDNKDIPELSTLRTWRRRKLETKQNHKSRPRNQNSRNNWTTNIL